MPIVGSTVFIFCSRQNARLFAITLDKTGFSLPSHYGPWQPSDDNVLHEVYQDADERIADAIRAAIVEHGFYLSRSDGVAW